MRYFLGNNHKSLGSWALSAALISAVFIGCNAEPNTETTNSSPVQDNSGYASNRGIEPLLVEDSTEEDFGYRDNYGDKSDSSIINKESELGTKLSEPLDPSATDSITTTDYKQLNESIVAGVETKKPANVTGRQVQLQKMASNKKAISRFARSSNASTPSPSTAPASPAFEMPAIAPLSGLVLPNEGKGPGVSGDKFDHIEENPFVAVNDQPLSTFSIDVDTASYSKVRSYLMDHQQLPPKGAVRIEELVNYFNYDYEGPNGEHPFAANAEVAACPWNNDHRLVRVGIKGQEVEKEERPASNLVFLIDVSGSMKQANKLPLLKTGMKMLVDQLGENDSVAIVVYASATGLVLDSTTGDRKAEIISSLDSLEAGGSTNGGAGMQLAYKVALEHFIKGGTNRVILCTDGDFNVGTTSTGGIVGFAEEQAKAGVYLSVLGFGTGNLNDSMMEQLSNKANGNYSFIDSKSEARKVLVEQMSGTLLTIAKDVKIQIEFNPKKVASYRLVGYENRMLSAQDFNDDKKDAGEIGAGHTVTAFYEVVPTGVDSKVVEEKVDDLKYQTERKPTKAAKTDELLTLKLRYKKPEEDKSTLMTYAIKDEGNRFNQSSSDFQFAASVAMFGMALNNSEHDESTNFDEIIELASSNLGEKPSSYREEFVKLVAHAKTLMR